MELGLDEDDLNKCVQCGLCLPSCPTYRVSGDDTMSPRGRIRLMREVQDNGAPVTKEVVHAFTTCVQCRACEPACPSGVPYGHLIEETREALTDAGEIMPKWQRFPLKSLAMPGFLRFGSSALGVAGRLKLLPKSLGIPRDLPIRREPLVPSGDDVWMFTGCVMDTWQRDVHQATQRVLEAAGYGVRPTGDAAPCCGALQAHTSMGPEAKELAIKVIGALGDKPVVVNSAGCGATMKEYGELLGTDEAHEFSSRVIDVCEFLAPQMDRLPKVEPLDVRVALQDPCHLRHVQKVHMDTRTVLRPYVRELVELDDDGMCCGAGGAFSVLNPALASEIRKRKVDTIDRASADVVASANPGCSMHLATVGVNSAHPMTLVDQAINP